jgi:hypothetical protein
MQADKHLSTLIHQFNEIFVFAYFPEMVFAFTEVVDTPIDLDPLVPFGVLEPAALIDPSIFLALVRFGNNGKRHQYAGKNQVQQTHPSPPS